MSEQDYINGKRAAWLDIARSVRQNLQPDDIDFDLERADVIQYLRRVCEEHGDNDWPDNLHLSDIIENHLLSHLT